MNLFACGIFPKCLEYFEVKKYLRFVFKEIHLPIYVKSSVNVMKNQAPTCETKCGLHRSKCKTSRIFVALWIIDLGAYVFMFFVFVYPWQSIACSWIGGMHVARPWVERKCAHFVDVIVQLFDVMTMKGWTFLSLKKMWVGVDGRVDG